MNNVAALAILVMLGSVVMTGGINAAKGSRTGEVQGVRSIIRDRFFRNVKPGTNKPVLRPTLKPTEEGGAVDASLDADLNQMVTELQSLEQEMNTMRLDARGNSSSLD
jgi:hypothetical protein